MENKNTSDSELRLRYAITNEYNRQVAETNQYIDIIESLLSSDDTIQKLESLACIQSEIVQSKNKWLTVHLSDINAEIEKLKLLNQIGLLHRPGEIDFSNLLVQLKPYFNDCSLIDLETIIKHKQLPIGRKRILWNGVKADAIRFAEHLRITKAQFNKMFYFADNIKLHEKNRDKSATRSNLSEILERYRI